MSDNDENSNVDSRRIVRGNKRRVLSETGRSSNITNTLSGVSKHKAQPTVSKKGKNQTEKRWFGFMFNVRGEVSYCGPLEESNRKMKNKPMELAVGDTFPMLWEDGKTYEAKCICIGNEKEVDAIVGDLVEGARRLSSLNLPIESSPPVPTESRGYSGRPLPAKQRDELEKKSITPFPIYPFPRFAHIDDFETFSPSQRKKGILLDLMEDEEVEIDDKTKLDYTIGSVLFHGHQGVLLNWDGFMYPSWLPDIDKKGEAYQDYERRNGILDQVMKNLMAKEKLEQSDLSIMYPNWTIMKLANYNENVMNPGIVYLSGLRKREMQINNHLEKHYKSNKGRQPSVSVIFADFTSFERSSIPTFEYLVEPTMSDAAEEIMKQIITDPDRRSCNCDKCKRSSCCCKPVYDSNNNANSVDDVHIYECGDDCPCDKKCAQRCVQKGRRGTLVIFQHPLKGWTLWTGTAHSKGSFVCEYAGKGITEKEAEEMEDQTFHFALDGNESRYLAHSCEPNLQSKVVHFDIEGRVKRRIAFFAKRDIGIGEELTIDYVPKTTDPKEFHDEIEKFGFACKCGSESCRETKYQEEK
ncbi:hypothetical protein PRIPAC_92356 [Pristionchus pacificus]|uniref:SET domain-containing protein n=1 Tax=Pristionchus pacificus TaxID=54126 RepID=A0A2A6BQP4_PRIPA|nr:hypothetical protein PRIPAC_92356 [Pristionchus pacificus]|eukprot:PDM68240.1 SET domain-containing protein [Pristionchus pacificus]